MGSLLKFMLIGSVCVSLLTCSGEPDQFVQFITNLKDVAPGDRNTVIAEYADIQTWPLIESDKVYFLLKSAGANKAYLSGDMNSWKPDSIALMKIPGTDYFFVEQSYPSDARIEYKFVVDGDFIQDPFNPNVTKNGFADNSFIMMPQYIFPNQILLKRNAHISRLDSINFYSRLLNNSRMVYLYHHPEAEKNSPLIIFHDGSDYLKFGHTCTILDNMIAAGSIPAVRALFIDPIDRMKEYWLNDMYLKMIFTELLPGIRKQVDMGKTAKVFMGGVSLSGLISLAALKNYGDQLDGVFSQSGAIWIENESILKLIDNLPLMTTKIYFDYGSLETEIKQTHRKLEDILIKNEIDYQCNEYNEGHNWANWRAHLPQALRFCLSKESVK